MPKPTPCQKQITTTKKEHNLEFARTKFLTYLQGGGYHMEIFSWRGITCEDSKEPTQIRRRSAKFLLIGDKMYRRSYSSPLQKCVAQDDAEPILVEVYEGICGSYIRSGSLTRILLRQGYIWSQIQEDTKRLVNKCKRCQEHRTYRGSFSNSSHQPIIEYHSLSGE